MKKIFCFAIIALGLSVVFSCQKEENGDFTEIEKTGNLQTFTCTIADLNSKVSVDAAGKTAWEDGDEIVIHGHKVNENVVVALHDFSNENKDATFRVDLSGVRGVSDVEGAYYVSYPADAYIGLTDEPGYNGYYSGFSDTNHPLLAGYLDGTVFKLYSLCGVLTFKVDGDYDGYIFEGNRAETVGYDEYRVKITSDTEDYKSWKTAGDKASVTGTVNGDGSTLNYVYFPNGASFPNGFTIYLMKDGVIKGYVTSDKSISIDRGHQKNMGLLPAGKIHARAMASWATNAIDLNNVGGKKQDPANSYLLVRSDAYRDKVFKIWAVKGNDLSQPVDGIASVEVLWESRCQGSSGTTPGFLIKDVDFDKNHIYFSTPAGDDFKDGNAVIAAKDSEGTILWSWHIWVSNTAVTTIESAAVSQKAVMDRNLGALKVATIDAVSDIMSYGLLYQWGRKDPFPGAKYVGSGSFPGFASAGSREFEATSDQLTLAESIENPMKIGCATDGYDWCTAETSSESLWSESTKTIYDPCPSGYRVMKRDKDTELWSDDNSDHLELKTGWSISSDNHSFTFGDPAVVFPIAGYKEGKTTTSSVGSRAAIWSSKSSGTGYAYILNIRYDKTQYTRTSTTRGRSCSVRCVAE